MITIRFKCESTNQPTNPATSSPPVSLSTNPQITSSKYSTFTTQGTETTPRTVKTTKDPSFPPKNPRSKTHGDLQKSIFFPDPQSRSKSHLESVFCSWRNKKQENPKFKLNPSFFSCCESRPKSPSLAHRLSKHFFREFVCFFLLLIWSDSLWFCLKRFFRCESPSPFSPNTLCLQKISCFFFNFRLSCWKISKIYPRNLSHPFSCSPKFLTHYYQTNSGTCKELWPKRKRINFASQSWNSINRVAGGASVFEKNQPEISLTESSPNSKTPFLDLY